MNLIIILTVISRNDYATRLNLPQITITYNFLPKIYSPITIHTRGISNKIYAINTPLILKHICLQISYKTTNLLILVRLDTVHSDMNTSQDNTNAPGKLNK